MRTILVVDDMAIFREPIEAVLRAEGLGVMTACDGGQAVAALSVNTPDLILLDLRLPVMSGIALLRHIRAEPRLKGVPVIILSGETDRGRIAEAVKLGISGYLLKSQFSLEVMLDRVQKALTSTEADRAGQDAEAHTAADGPARAAALATDQGPQPPSPTMIHQGGYTPARVVRVPAPVPGSTPHAAMCQVRGLRPETGLKSLRPLVTRSVLLERLQADSELMGFSPTVSQVLKITASERSSLEQVARAVSQDQAVALKILKLANSSVYSRGDHVDTVQKAVQRIGVDNIRQTVLNIGVVERFGSMAFDQYLSTPLFWEHSIACGLIAAELAHALKHKEPDVAFTAGLLHDLGRVIYADRLGQDYVRVLEAACTLQVPVEEVESRLLQIDHAAIMDGLLHAWRFPKELVAPIVFHHVAAGDVRSVAPHQAQDVLRLGLANRLAHAMVMGSSGNDTIYPTEEHCRLLGVGADTIGMIERTVRQHCDDTKIALLSRSGGCAWPCRIEQHRAGLTVPFRPLFASATPALDAYRIFCDELAGPTDEGPPNVAVIHVAAAKDRADIRDLLFSMEQKRGVQALPLLILSPGGQVSLPKGDLAVRRSLSVGTPTHIGRFLAAVNELVDVGRARSAA